MRCLIFFWRNNEALGLVASTILLIMLYLQEKKSNTSFLWKKNQAPDYVFRKNASGASFFLKR
jgi:hypothetical protein